MSKILHNFNLKSIPKKSLTKYTAFAGLFVGGYYTTNTVLADFTLKLAFDSAKKEIEERYGNTFKNRELWLTTNTKLTTNEITQLLNEIGMSNNLLTNHISNIIAKQNTSELMTLFDQDNNQNGLIRKKRYKFLFDCLDIDNNGKINAENFIDIFTSLLDSRYYLFGSKSIFVHNNTIKCLELDLPNNINNDEYHIIAKYKSYQLVNKIFTQFDTKKRGQLKFNDFVFWAENNSKEFLALEYLFSETLIALGLQK